jgi:hypothetical protein
VRRSIVIRTNVDVTGQFIYAIGKDITEIRELRHYQQAKIIKRCTKIAK